MVELGKETLEERRLKVDLVTAFTILRQRDMVHTGARGHTEQGQQKVGTSTTLSESPLNQN